MTTTAAPQDRIPVQNLLRLAFYAGEMLEELEDCEADMEAGIAGFRELLAAMLARSANRLRRGGFQRGYSSLVECSSRPRGRILIRDSIERLSMSRNQLVHEHDELDMDTPDNRVLMASATILIRAQVGNFDDEDAPTSMLRVAVRDLRDVADVKLTSKLLRALPRSVAGRRYRMSRFVARLLTECAEPDAARGADWARELLQDPQRMRRLFERFVKRWCEIHKPEGFEVVRSRFYWDSKEDHQRGGPVPTLNTDVTVDAPSWMRIIECKYTARLLVHGVYGVVEQYRADHLRQLYSYLARAWSAELERAPHNGRAPRRPVGLLLYPAAGRHVGGRIRLGEFEARVATLDLTLPWPQMSNALKVLALDQ